MFTIRHYFLDNGQVQIVESLIDLDTAQLHIKFFADNDHGTASVWYIDDDGSVTEQERVSESDSQTPN